MKKYSALISTLCILIVLLSNCKNNKLNYLPKLSLKNERLKECFQLIQNENLNSITNSVLDTVNPFSSAQEVELIEKSVPQISNHVSVVAVIELISNYWIQHNPQKVFDLIVAYPNEIQNLYSTYIKSYNTWLKVDYANAKSFLINTLKNSSEDTELLKQDLFSVLVKHNLKSGVNSTFDWISSFNEPEVQKELTSALVDISGDTPLIEEISDWFGTICIDTSFKTVMENYIVSYAQANPVNAYRWTEGLESPEMQYYALKKLFYFYGYEYAFIGSNWFNSYTKRHKLFGKKYSNVDDLKRPKSFERIIAQSYIKGLVENTGTGVHPSEIIASINDITYKTLLEKELQIQLKQ